MLACAGGADNTTVAQRLGCEAHTVEQVAAPVRRAAPRRAADEPRPGPPRTITDAKVEDVTVTTLEATPPNATHWTPGQMAERTGL